MGLDPSPPPLVCIASTSQTEEIALQKFGSPDHYRNPVRSFECLGLRLLTWKFVGNFGDCRDFVFDMHGDSRENLLDILVVVIISSTISSICGSSLYCEFAFYGVAQVSRLLKKIGLFCKRAL